MATFSPIVEINIGLNTVASTREGFGIPLNMSYHNAWEDSYRVYGSIAGVAEDFDVQSSTYKSASVMFAQTPTVVQYIIGRLETAPLLSIEGLAEGVTYDITMETFLDGVSTQTGSASITVTVGMTELTVLEQIEVALGTTITGLQASFSGGAPATDFMSLDHATETLVITAKTDNLIVSGGASVLNAQDPVQAVQDLMDFNSDWYFLTHDADSTHAIEIAEYIEGTKKMFFCNLRTADEYGAIDPALPTIGEELMALNLDRTVTFHNQGEATPANGWIGYNAPYDAGSVTWANNTLNALEASKTTTGGKLSATMKTNLLARNINYIDSDAGIDFTRTGINVNGEWIDTIRGRDWLAMEMERSLIDLLVNQKGGKVKFTDAGINQVRSVMEGVLTQGVTNDFLESYTTSFPRAIDIPFAEKQSRVLSGISFVGYLAGAIHEVTVEGSLTYSTGGNV